MSETIGIVAADYHKELADEMLHLAKKEAEKLGVRIGKIIHVAGSYDIPLPAKKLLEMEEIKGVVALGAIIQGKTDHDCVIAYSVAKALTELSLQFNKPVALGITGPKMTLEQAFDRVGRASDAVRACVNLIRGLKG